MSNIIISIDKETKNRFLAYCQAQNKTMESVLKHFITGLLELDDVKKRVDPRPELAKGGNFNDIENDW